MQILPQINQIIYSCQLRTNSKYSIGINTQLLSVLCKAKKSQFNVCVCLFGRYITIKVSHKGHLFLFVRGFEIVEIHNNIKRIISIFVDKYIVPCSSYHTILGYVKVINVQFQLNIPTRIKHASVFQHCFKRQYQIDETVEAKCTKYIIESTNTTITVYPGGKITGCSRNLSNFFKSIEAVKNYI